VELLSYSASFKHNCLQFHIWACMFKDISQLRKKYELKTRPKKTTGNTRAFRHRYVGPTPRYLRSAHCGKNSSEGSATPGFLHF
jgi:hypothetical protein